MRFFLLVTLFVFARGVVLFEGYRDSICNNRVWGSPGRPYLPLTDRVQGVDTQVAGTVYSGSPPATFGTWTITDTNATLCNLGTCQSWTVYPAVNTSVCDRVGPFGWGRFYKVAGPVAMVLWRTTGQMTTPACQPAENYQWVAYAITNVVPSSAACSTTVEQVFYEGDKLTLFTPTRATWTGTQPCGGAPYPGEKCFASGEGYCSVNKDCAIDHGNRPTYYPWFGAGATTVKIVTANSVGGAGSGGGSSGGAVALTACLTGFIVIMSILF